nr:TIGR00730 family Rossman fold protein [uncultured Mogibacterium sp.]
MEKEKKDMNITVYCGSRFGEKSVFKDRAIELGNWIAESGHSLVYGGGNVGLMGTVANTVLEGGAKVYGVIPEFLLDQEKGHEGLYTLEIVESMPERKTRMINLGDAFIALPGGPGTLEEISEIISLRRLNRTEKPCIVYNINGFYDPLKRLLDEMVAADFLPAEDLDKVIFANNLDEIKAAISER